MNPSAEWRRIQSHPVGESTAACLLAISAETSPGDFLDAALRVVCQWTEAEAAVLYRAARGAWRRLAASPSSGQAPEALLADVLDSGEPQRSGDWIAVALQPHTAAGAVVALRGRQLQPLVADAAAAALLAAWTTVRQCQEQALRAERLQTLLEISARWRRTQELDPLLHDMAEASTQLLGAERASIFLWDRRSHTLVGRPALGVEGGELRIADNAGVVGEVVQSGQPRRVDSDLAMDQQRINRQVDQQLDFQTRSLLCAPLRTPDGRVIGAFEMINKRQGNFTDEDETALVDLAAHASIALAETQQYEQLLKRRQVMVDEAASHVQLIGKCQVVEQLREVIHRVADTDLALLILGENGTGKEVVSQLTHYLSRRRNEPFVAVNCAALSESLLESELFGHEKGAFTDARETRQGKFEAAAGGTLFLDEIGDMSLGGQAKLLRVLEQKVVVRVGGSQLIPTDVRIIAATNQDLELLVRERKFRQDLFFRLHVVPLRVPALRERGEDVLLLARHFLADFSGKARRPVPELTEAAERTLLAHPWPGNVRELRNLMERLVYLHPGPWIDAADLQLSGSGAATSVTAVAGDDRLELGPATQEFQVRYIQRHIDRAAGNMTAAAETLGLHRSNLYRKMKQLGML